MDVREFQEKLKKMQELAKEQGGSLRAEQIREEFSGSDLNSSQLVNVLKYLTGQGILIEGGCPHDIFFARLVPIRPAAGAIPVGEPVYI